MAARPRKWTSICHDARRRERPISAVEPLMANGQTSFRIADAARPAVVDRELSRPDWTSGSPRDRRQLWLDKNENTDPDLASVTSRLVADVLAGPGSPCLSTYPDQRRLSKAGAHVECSARQLMLTVGSDGAIRAVFEAFVNSGRHHRPHVSDVRAMYPVYARCRCQGCDAGLPQNRGGPVASVDQVVAAVSQTRPKLLCLPNPGQSHRDRVPTGRTAANRRRLRRRWLRDVG